MSDEHAKQLADKLFMSGAGIEADRLVLMTKDGRDLGGWSKRAVVDVLSDALREDYRLKGFKPISMRGHWVNTADHSTNAPAEAP